MATPDDLDNEFADIDEDDDLEELDDLDIDDDSDDDLDEIGLDDDEDADDSDEEGDDDGEDGDDEDDAPEEDEDPDLDDDDDEEEEESLDVILAREQDLEDEFAPSSDGGRTSPSSTPAGDDEFTCRSCFLVKRRAQLADADELICFDCA
jgi:hypothetical protein